MTEMDMVKQTNEVPGCIGFVTVNEADQNPCLCAFE